MTLHKNERDVPEGEQFFVLEIDLDRLREYGPPGSTPRSVLKHLAAEGPFTTNDEGFGQVWTENMAHVGTYHFEDRS